MSTSSRYRIVKYGLTFGLALLASGRMAHAQAPNPAAPKDADLYCSGLITTEKVPDKLYVISGEDSRYKTTFQPGNFVYTNATSGQGAKVGDEFEIVRPVNDMTAEPRWFKYQSELSRAMGTRYADIGRLRIVHVDDKTSTAEVNFGCDLIQRGDIIRPFVARPVPQFHDVKLDPFAAPSGKKAAMVVSGKDYAVLDGPGRIVYVNLGATQGVKVGDYFRVFRYQGTRTDANYQLEGTAYKIFGFGGTPTVYEWNNLPRQILGEGIVLRTSPNSATVLLTTVRHAIYAGDYVEVE